MFGAALAVLALSVACSFWAGGTADLKSGAWGDPRQSFNIEGLAGLLLVAGSSFCGAGFQIGYGLRRPWIGAVTVLGTLALFWLVGFQSEAWGTQICCPG